MNAFYLHTTELSPTIFSITEILEQNKDYICKIGGHVASLNS